MVSTKTTKPSLAKRALAFVLAAALGITGVNTQLFGLAGNSHADTLGIMNNFSVNADSTVRFQPSTTYYDSGTMLLNGYYDPLTGAVSADQYNTFWQTTNVVSSVADSTVTLPATTDINNADQKPMQCWKDHISSTQVEDFGTPGAHYGREDSNGDGVVDDNDVGMLYNYIAKGVSSAKVGDQVTITWEIRAWRSALGADAPTTQAAIQSEWNTETIWNNTRPRWKSGNANWDDWSTGSCLTWDQWLDIKTTPYTNAAAPGGMDFTFKKLDGSTNNAHIDETNDTASLRAYTKGDNTSTYDSLKVLGADGSYTYPMFNVPGVIRTVWSGPALADVYNSDSNITAVRLYDIGSNVWFKSDDGQYYEGRYNGAKSLLHYTLDGEHGESVLSDVDVATRLCLTDIYDQYWATTGAVKDGAVVIESGVGNTKKAFDVRSVVKYDTTTGYQRSGGTITGTETYSDVTIETDAIDTQTGTQYGNISTSASITDVISYSGLEVGGSYIARGELYVIDGITVAPTGITANKVFTPVTDAGVTQVVFNFDSTPYAGKTLVAYETIVKSGAGTIAAAHTDATDTRQMVYYASLRTTAKDVATNSSSGIVGTNTSIRDTVTYYNLNAHTSYYLEGALMVKSDGGSVTPVMNGTAPVTVKSDPFVPVASTGTIDMVFTFDSTPYTGKDIVVFETLKRSDDDSVCIDHSDVNDINQTVHYELKPVTVTTRATDASSNTQQGVYSAAAQITDEVTYTDLTAGAKYVIEGSLYVLNDDGTVMPLVIDGKTVTSTTSFSIPASATVPTANGTKTVTFKFDSRGLSGKTLVVYETIYQGEIVNGVLPTVVVGRHTDATDTQQMIYYADLSTVAKDAVSGTQVAVANSTAAINDVVTYDNLIPGNTYRVYGSLMTKDNNGNEISITKDSAYKEFTPNSKSGSVDVSFAFDATKYAGKDIVVYEKLVAANNKSVVFAEHDDIDDANQTIHYNKEYKDVFITTDALDPVTDSQQGTCSSAAKIVDIVSYAGLEPGTSYTVEGTLYELLDDGNVKAVKNNGKIVTSSVVFRPQSENGKVDVPFTFDSRTYAGKTIVVYESIYEYVSGNGIILGEPIAVHENAKDTRQMIYYPFISTKASDTAYEGTAVINSKSTIIDVVTYKNLIPGMSYRLNGSLMAADVNGNAYEVRGNNSSTSVHKDFTPTEPNGTVSLLFEFDSTKYADKSIVVYEKLVSVEKTSVVYVNHDDINDVDQTVHYRGADPYIETDAINALTNSQMGVPSVSDTITDTVLYHNLTPGTAYTAVGYLYKIDARGDLKPVENNRTQVSAIKSFTPTSADGSVNVIFNFDSSACDGVDVVVFEELYEGTFRTSKDVLGKSIARHEDEEDPRQTISYHSLSTSAVDGATGTRMGAPSVNSTIVDTVYYRNLVPGNTYIVTGQLYDKSTKQPIKSAANTTIDINKATTDIVDYTVDKNGYVTASTTFRATTANGSVEVRFAFDSTAYAGKDVVVFETLYSANGNNKTEIMTHGDVNDIAQTISYAYVSTRATDAMTGLRESAAKNETYIRDEVSLKNIAVGNTYTLKGYLVRKSTGERLKDYAGNDISATTTFRSSSASSTQILTYKFDSTALAGDSVVAVVYLMYGNTMICAHDDLNDTQETIVFPAIRTYASVDMNGKIANPIASAVVTDTVEYTNLIPGNSYRLTGSLMVKSTGKPAVNVNGSRLIATADFRPTEANGSIDVVFNGVDLSKYEGESLVIYQSLQSVNGGFTSLLAEDNDINNANETIRVNSPKITTVLAETDTGEKNITLDADVRLTDTVTYNQLVPGDSYIIVSTLMDKETRSVIKDDAKREAVIESDRILAYEPDISVTADFEFTGLDLAGRSVVAFNDIYRISDDGTRQLIASEHDYNNADQTVDFKNNCKLDTVALDFETDSHTLTYSTNAKIVDTVNYSGLRRDKNYTLITTVHDAATGDAITGIASITTDFVAENANGHVTVEIPLDATKYTGKSLVVFETLMSGDDVVCEHTDINDEDQTVHAVEVSTVLTANDKTSKAVAIAEAVTVSDIVRFDGLTPGRTYKIIGHILDKEVALGTIADTQQMVDDNGGLIIDGDEGTKVTNGEKIVAERTIEFTPSESSGAVTVDFVVNTSQIFGHHLVAFETIYDSASGVEVGEHKNVNDANQTVVVKTTTTVYTGVANFAALFTGISIAMLIAGVVVIIVVKKRRSAK